MDADELYAKAQLETGSALDKCVLYASRCAVAFAEEIHRLAPIPTAGGISATRRGDKGSR